MVMGLRIETDTEMVYPTPNGTPVSMAIRPGSSDANTVMSCGWGNDEYHLPRGLSGWALDVGAHIGAATVPLLIDNPDLRVVAIEALPENAALLRENLRRNGLTERCVVLEAAASDTTKPVRIGYGPRSGELQHSEFIGSASAPKGSDFIKVPGASLKMALEIAGGEFAWAKIDCEGCEYSFFDTPLVSQIAYITGEHHFGFDRVKALLDATHIVTMEGGTESFGHFTAARR